MIFNIIILVGMAAALRLVWKFVGDVTAGIFDSLNVYKVCTILLDKGDRRKLVPLLKNTALFNLGFITIAHLLIRETLIPRFDNFTDIYEIVPITLYNVSTQMPV